jgi:hypothetical protein
MLADLEVSVVLLAVILLRRPIIAAWKWGKNGMERRQLVTKAK